MYDIYGNNNHPVYIQGDYRFTKFVVDGALELGDHKITNNTVSVLSG